MRVRHITAVGVLLGLLLAAAGFLAAAGRVEFFSPWWLLALAAIPLAAILAITGRSGLPSRTNAVSLSLRSLLLLLLILCLAGMHAVLDNNGICAIFVLDHSASVPDEIARQQIRYVNAASATKAKDDTAGVIIFADNASVEITPEPEKELNVGPIYSWVGKQFTDIQSAVELAVAAFPANMRRKIVLVTDGNQNKGDLVEGVKFAAANGALTDILPVSYEYKQEVLVEKVHLPDRIKENETFDLRANVISLSDTPAELCIYRNGQAVSRRNIQLKRGRNAYVVSMKIEEPGFYSFAARVNAPSDTLAENNEASGYVYIQGASRILFVAPTELEVRYLRDSCAEENLETDTISPAQFPESLGTLQNYDCVVLANVGANEVGDAQLDMLRASVRDLGMGLIMVGGENAFGAGGYSGTPVEEALPVTMDIKQKKINPKGALVIVLHTCEFADGNYWAKEISRKAIETVGALDEVGVLMYAGGEQWLFEMREAGDKSFMLRKVSEASPGDMPSFEPTLAMAHRALSQSDAMVKHVIIISDGDPASPPPEMVKNIGASGISISTVAINPHSPRDVDVMKYLAYSTQGRYYFAADPAELPRIFVKEAKVVKRSLIFNKKFQPLLVLATEVTKGILPEEVPPLMAYVATTPKARALVPMVSDNENHDPVLAYWQFGLGKAAAFTSDATSNWAREWVGWKKYKKFWTQTIRWASRKREASNLRVRREMAGNKCRLVIDAIDNQGKFMNFLKLSGRVVGPDNKGETLDVRQTAPGRYEASFEPRQVGVSIVNIAYHNPQTGGSGFAADGVCVPYSPEFQKLESNMPLLRNAAAAGGGRLLSGDAAKDLVFASTLPAARSFRPIYEYLLIAALIVFLFDVVVRRVIITAQDVRAAWFSVRRAVSFRRRPTEKDATVAALLRRKQKTFESPAGGPAAAARFKENLLRTAARNKQRIEVEQVDGEAGPGPMQTPAPDTDQRKEQTKKEDETTYTSRLLQAKKRAGKRRDSQTD